MVKLLGVLFVTVFSASCWAAQDPTAPLGWEKPKQTQAKKNAVVYRVPTLQSIVCSDNSTCKAILNGKVVATGETVSGYKVTRIESERVTVSRGGKQWNLELFSLDIKQ